MILDCYGFFEFLPVCIINFRFIVIIADSSSKIVYYVLNQSDFLSIAASLLCFNPGHKAYLGKCWEQLLVNVLCETEIRSDAITVRPDWSSGSNDVAFHREVIGIFLIYSVYQRIYMWIANEWRAVWILTESFYWPEHRSAIPIKLDHVSHVIISIIANCVSLCLWGIVSWSKLKIVALEYLLLVCICCAFEIII